MTSEAKPGEMITENHYLDATGTDDGYATSKLESEMEVWRGIAEGLKAVIVNPTIILGGNDWNKSSAEIFKTVYKEFPYY